MQTKKRPYVLYVLECEGRRYYVGCSANFNRRLKDHNKPKGGSWFTKKYRFVKIKEVVYVGIMTEKEAIRLECELAYKYICEHGFKDERVRGGDFIQRDPKHFVHLLDRYK